VPYIGVIQTMQRALLLACLAGFATACEPPGQTTPEAFSTTTAHQTAAMEAKPDSSAETNEPVRVTRTDEEWRQLLTPEQYRVLRQAGTERAFGPAYEEFKKQGTGTYQCAGCGAVLFSSVRI
jgi:hypothetical protein